MYKNSSINPTGEKLNMFIEKDKADIHKGITFNGSIYALNKDINLKGKARNITYMNGAFIGKKVKGEKGVVWDWDIYCANNCPIVPAKKTIGPVIVSEGNEAHDEITSLSKAANPAFLRDDYTVKTTRIHFVTKLRLSFLCRKQENQA